MDKLKEILPFAEFALLLFVTITQLGRWVQKTEDGDKASFATLSRVVRSHRSDFKELEEKVVPRLEFDEVIRRLDTRDEDVCERLERVEHFIDTVRFKI